MKNFIDIQPGDWFYQEVVEACNYELQDGQALWAGIPYGIFKEPHFYKEITAWAGQTEFDCGTTITVTATNPLYVYINGVQTVYKGLKTSSGTLGNSGNIIVLYSGVQQNSIVSICQVGVPQLYKDDDLNHGIYTPTDDESIGRPVPVADAMYPCKPLQYGYMYYYDPQHMRQNEYCYAYGRALKRATIPYREWNSIDTLDKLQALLRKYIGYKIDTYTICPNDPSIFPFADDLRVWALSYGVINPSDPNYGHYPNNNYYGDNKYRSWIFLPYNLENVTCKLEYVIFDESDWQYKVKSGEFRVASPNGKVNYNDRFFPNAGVMWCEAYAVLNRLRRSFYSRFTDAEATNTLVKANGTTVLALDETQIAYEGQTVFHLCNTYIPGQNDIKVYVNGTQLPSSKFTQTDKNTITLKGAVKRGDKVRIYGERTSVTRFTDVPDNYWAKWDIMALELEQFDNGEYLLQPYYSGDTLLEPDLKMLRYDVVVLLNRFRKWCVEKFKL